jgi:putative ABC transport system substrate-binding protein
MRRRDFIKVFGASASIWPFAARAQQSAKPPTIGFLGAGTPIAWKEWVAAFVQRLHELNWIEGRTVKIEYRWAEGNEQRYTELAAEFVRLKVDVIVTSGAAVDAAKQATSVIPIVFGVANDPLTTGLVASLARPGGNVTGLSLLAPDLAGKRIEILREVFPALRRLAVMGNVDYPASVLEISKVQATAGAIGLETSALEIRRAEDIAPAIDGLNGRAAALYVCAACSPMHLVSTNWHLGRAYRQSMAYGRLWTDEGSSPMDQTSQTYGDAPPTMWIKFYMGRSLPTFRSSSQPSLNLS